MYILDAMNHKNKVMSSLEYNPYKYHIIWHIIIIFNKIRVGKKWPHTVGFESVLFLLFVVESKILFFQCKVENFKKTRKFWLPPRCSEAPGPLPHFVNFQLCIERFLFVVLEGYTSLQRLQIAKGVASSSLKYSHTSDFFLEDILI